MRSFHDEFMEEPLPDWAHSLAGKGMIVPMLQLHTRDGTRTGNATVSCISKVSFKVHPKSGDLDVIEAVPFIWVVTDSNNWMCLNPNEIHELFTLGKYVLREFPNPLSNAGNPHTALIEDEDVMQYMRQGRVPER